MGLFLLFKKGEGYMTEQAKEERRGYMRNYMREYRKKNKSKMSEIQARYWNNKALGKEKEFINQISQDSKIMHELKSEKLVERLKADETGAFYMSDLENQILEIIQEK